MPEIILTLESCRQCPYFITNNQWSSDGWDRMEDWVCTKTSPNTVIQGAVEWHEEKKIKIPDWCPCLFKNVKAPPKKWYEGLTVDELPRYVKYENKVYRIIHWNYEFGTSEEDMWLFFNDIVPATEKEYIENKTT